MPYVVSLTGYRPSARYDSLPWTQARIEEAASASGPWTALETKTLSPVDSDPSDPELRDFTTDDATLANGWYRVVFIDAAAREEASGATSNSAQSGDLTTLESVRDFMQKDSGSSPNDEQDGLIETLIPAASRAIQRFTRIIAPAETAATKSFEWWGRGCLSVDPWLLRSITSITIGTTSATGYTLEPANTEDGVYRTVNLSGYETYPSNLELQDPFYVANLRQTVSVTGDWGYASVPDDVQHWANVTVVEWIRKDVSAFSTAFDVNEDRLDRPEALPSAVRRGLAYLARDEYR